MSDLLQNGGGGELGAGYTFPARFEGGELDPPPNVSSLPRLANPYTLILKTPNFNFQKFIVGTVGHPCGLTSGSAFAPVFGKLAFR
ncbi:hypothetical protein CH354_02270 [Leptospira levettii]|nr:hypothetical protein CH354_02270 [Leptospira levettii]PKA01161.1 hypothetical protein CH369_05050 [Leptospira levettii]